MVELTPQKEEVMGSNPARCRDSFPTFLPSLWGVLNQVPQGGASLQVCVVKEKWMPSYAAWGETSTIGLD